MGLVEGVALDGRCAVLFSELDCTPEEVVSDDHVTIGFRCAMDAPADYRPGLSGMAPADP